MLPNAFLRVREMQRDKKRSPKANNSALRFLQKRSEIDRDFKDFFEEESGKPG